MTSTAMSEVPTIPQPIGVASQFDDPPPQKATLVIVSSISISLMMVCSALQVYSRSFLLRIPFGLEDGKYENLRCRWIQLSNSAASGLAVVVLSTIIYLLYVLIKYYFHQLGSIVQRALAYYCMCFPSPRMLHVSNLIQWSKEVLAFTYGTYVRLISPRKLLM